MGRSNMSPTRGKVIFKLCEEIHEGLDTVYEHLMDDEGNEGAALIDDIIAKLRHLKSNAVTKEN